MTLVQLLFSFPAVPLLREFAAYLASGRPPYGYFSIYFCGFQYLHLLLKFGGSLNPKQFLRIFSPFLAYTHY